MIQNVGSWIYYPEICIMSAALKRATRLAKVSVYDLLT
ncbi:hypothetical protein EMEDMD4_1310078 [Sinorhizobium medicae]|uniref:Uncharacterized protein n=1 Tax=Sinorhizobium medicae TaxID=110321 RepID=A0A508WRQ3_9HYPH|nr:hypothetical protein EMEDMD4_1310078 [Sinorhizobium medicae]